MSFLILLPMFVLMYVLLILPQKRRQVEAAALRNKASVGDEILTTSGLYGIITAMDDEDIWLEVSENTEILMARGAILRITQSADEPASTQLPELAESVDTENEPEA
jgi:preprotein translocase subunit YajC